MGDDITSVDSRDDGSLWSCDSFLLNKIIERRLERAKMETKKTNLMIEDFERKVSKDGKTQYTRFKTNDGWMSCFDKTLIEDTINSKGKTLECEISIDDQDRKILQKVLGVTEGMQTVEVVNPKTMEPITTNKSTTMYVSYAKDVFNAILEDGNFKGNNEDMMNSAIVLVKQAKEAFS